MSLYVTKPCIGDTQIVKLDYSLSLLGFLRFLSLCHFYVFTGTRSVSDSFNGNGPCVNVERVATEKGFCVSENLELQFICSGLSPSQSSMPQKVQADKVGEPLVSLSELERQIFPLRGNLSQTQLSGARERE